MLKEPSTYEIMRPEDVGFAKTDLVLGKHSGRAALADRASQLGYALTGEQLQQVFAEFKDLADKKKEVYDGDIVALIDKNVYSASDRSWTLVDFNVSTGMNSNPQVTLTLKKGEEEFTETMGDGDGPIDAAFLATEKITGISMLCKEFRVQSATIGRDAQGEVVVAVEHEGRLYRGRGVSTNTVGATVLAILDSVNRIEIDRPNPKTHG